MGTSSDRASVGESPLLTLAEAADLLDVTPSAISQMLDKGQLDGPTFPGRAPKGAGRVTQESALARKQARMSEPRRGPRGPADDGGAEIARLRQDVASLHDRMRTLEPELRRARNGQNSVRAGLLAMKIAADRALESARDERKRNRALAAEITRLSRLLEDSQDQTERVDASAQGFSDTLTQLLVPTDPADLEQR